MLWVQKHCRQCYQICQDRKNYYEWTCDDTEEWFQVSLDSCLVLGCNHDVERVQYNFSVHNWGQEKLKDGDGHTEKEDQTWILNFVDHLIQLLVLYEDDHWHERNHEDIDWEESGGYWPDDRLVGKMVLHFQDSLQSDRILVLIDRLIGVREHSNKQIQQQYEVDQDKENQECLTLPLLERTEVLFTIESREHSLSNSPKAQLISSKLFVHIEANEHKHHKRNQESSEEFGQISPQTHHHYNGWTQSTSSSEHTQDVQRILHNDDRDDVREVDHVWVYRSETVSKVKSVLLFNC